VETQKGYCLNCETPLQGKYCHACGQKASTHRISFKKFIEHDLMHGIFHLDRGLLFTLKALFFIPGHAARSYLDGKRVKHYNIFALFIIIITVKMILDSHTVSNSLITTNNEALDEKVNQYLRNYYKIIYLFFIPILALFSSLFFGRLRYNFTEHMVAAAFVLTSGLICATFLSLIGYFTHDHDFVLYGFLASILYLMFPYYQLAKNHYFFVSYFWRAVLLITFVTFMILAGLLTVLLIAYDGNFEGEIGIRITS